MICWNSAAVPAGEFSPVEIEDAFVDFSDSEKAFSSEIPKLLGAPEGLLSAGSPAGTPGNSASDFQP